MNTQCAYFMTGYALSSPVKHFPGATSVLAKLELYGAAAASASAISMSLYTYDAILRTTLGG